MFRRLGNNVGALRATPMPSSSVMACAARSYNVNRATQRQQNAEFSEGASRRTEYDFDKEKWMKQMKFATMDCVMDPDLKPARYTTFGGLKKAFKQWVTMKKLQERRPDFHLDELKELYIDYKKLSHERVGDFTKLARVTTHTEANRIKKDIEKTLNNEFSKNSWKSLKTSTADSQYEVKIESMDLVNCYMGSMTSEDWLQITMKCVFEERIMKTDDFVKITEYPTFEVRLGDGLKTTNNSPFIVVAVMKKDGTRYGRDSQDASELKKNFDKGNKWF